MSAYYKTSLGYTVQKENDKDSFKDIRLNNNGTSVTLKDEVVKKVQSYQKKGCTPCLQHDLMVITHNDKNETISSVTENILKNSEINWNVLSVEGRQSSAQKSEILRFLKPFKVIIAAKEAKIIKQNVWQNIAGTGLVLLLCFVVSGVLNSIYGGGFQNGSDLVSLRELFCSYSFAISYGLLSIAGLIVYGLMKRYRLVRDKRIQTVITDYANRIDSLEDERCSFSQCIRNEILNLEMPLAIVVRDIDDLDVLSKKVLMEMLATDRQQTIGLILWVLVDKERSGSENELFSFAKKQVASGTIQCHAYRFESFV